MTDNEKIEKRKADLRQMLKSFELKVDTVGATIEHRFLIPMINEAELYATEIMDDYDFLVSHEVKEMVLQDFKRVTQNIKTMRFVEKHHKDVIPTFERLGTYKDIKL